MRAALAMEHLVQMGMRAAIRDVQDWVDTNAWHDSGVDCDETGSTLVCAADRLKAYLLAMLITAGMYEDLHDGQS